MFFKLISVAIYEVQLNTISKLKIIIYKSKWDALQVTIGSFTSNNEVFYKLQKGVLQSQKVYWIRRPLAASLFMHQK